MDILYRTLRSVGWLLVAVMLVGLQPLFLTAQSSDIRSEVSYRADAQPKNSIGNTAERFIQQGRQLEIDGHWADALSLYQQAIKNFPRNQKLIEKRTIARIHYDLERRYSDNSFRRALTQTDSNTALKIYSEVLLRVQSSYVDQPDWARLASFGLHSLEVAIRSPEFRQANIPNSTDQSIRNSIDQIRKSLGGETVGSRSDALNIAQKVADGMQSLVGLPVQSTIYEFTNGAIAALDPYSSYMSDSQFGEAMSQIEGNFVGLGVELRTHEDHLEIVSVISGGPAHSSNIAKNDRITAVDGRNVKDTGSEKAADMLRGIEGSFVSVTVERDGIQPQSIRLQRRRVDIPSVEDIKIIDEENKVGYIRLTNFQKKTTRDFDSALWKLHSQGMQSLIVDVRGNPGGLLSASVDVANRFVASGVIVSTRGRNPIENYTYRADFNNTWQVPLVVLIDENSASASEVFAAAIRDHRRGTIVGHQSFGKGSVQGIFRLNVSSGGVRLTTAKFYSPHGNAISEIGVKPHVKVQYTAKTDGNVEPSEDNALRVGIDVANQSVAKRQKQPQRGAIAGR
ncbi:MAG: S41 family peptidase [Planctomycetota bacterium]